MNKLTKYEIDKYVREPNKLTGVDGISREYLESLDLDMIATVVKKGTRIVDLFDTPLYRKDNYSPRAGTTYLKPSFAGRQVLMGREGRELYFSNGGWFC